MAVARLQRPTGPRLGEAARTVGGTYVAMPYCPPVRKPSGPARTAGQKTLLMRRGLWRIAAASPRGRPSGLSRALRLAWPKYRRLTCHDLFCAAALAKEQNPVIGYFDPIGLADLPLWKQDQEAVIGAPPPAACQPGSQPA